MYKELDSLHEKILNSKFAEEVTEQEILALVEAKEIRAKVIDEFAERLKSDEFQKYNLDMVFETSRDLSYSHCINAFHEYVDEIAEQLKAGGINE